MKHYRRNKMGLILDILADWKPLDYNGDGHITGNDIAQCGFEPGSAQAKLAWEKVYAKAHSVSAVKQAKLCGFDNASGWYDGKPLFADPGPNHNPTADDYLLLKDRLIWYKGLEPKVAQKIVSKLLEQAKTNLMDPKIPGIIK
jgi:hypothetical protein